MQLIIYIHTFPLTERVLQFPSHEYLCNGGRTIGMRTIGMRIIGMEDNWHAENWHGGQLALTF